MVDYATILGVGLGLYLSADAFYTSVMLGKLPEFGKEIKPYGPVSWTARRMRRQARREFW